MSSSARVAFQVRPLGGFTSQKVESIAVASMGEKLFVGTNDGTLVVYDIETNSAGTYECCRPRDIPRKERRPIQSLQAVESWRALLGVMDSFLVAYDLYTFRPLTALVESKGCSLYGVHAPSRQLCLCVKKKVMAYNWQGTSFTPRREWVLSEAPRAILCTSDVFLFALRREYVSISLQTGGVTKILDMDKEHRTVTLVEIPPIPSRPTPRVLASNGDKGVFLEIEDGGRVTRVPDDRITWSGMPKASLVSLPYLVTLLNNDRIEVHDLSTLAPVQQVDLTISPLALCSCKMGPGKTENVYTAGATAANVLVMYPLQEQVKQLLAIQAYEEAIAICSMFEDREDDRAMLAGIPVEKIHELYADVLFSKHSYEEAVDHYIKAQTPITIVCAHFNLFPEDLPLPTIVRDMLAKKTPPMNTTTLTGVQLSRASSALLICLQHHRSTTKEAADRIECHRAGRGAFLSSEGRRAMESDQEEKDTLLIAGMVDTMMVVTALYCKPPRRDETILLLKGPNRCHMDSCGPLLATEGTLFVEALLWLYRSKGEHRRALGLLTEEKCVAKERGKGWSLPEFHRWMSEYLGSLWRSRDASLASVVLGAARPLLEGNPKLGLQVFVDPPSDDDTTSPPGTRGASPPRRGNDPTIPWEPVPRGVQPQDVLNFLKSINPRVKDSEWKGPGGLTKANRGLFYRAPRSTIEIPLVSGTTLAVAYLDWLIAVGGAPPTLHDELFLLLLTGLLTEEKEAATQGGGSSSPPPPTTVPEEGRSPTELGRVFQDKLREFLRTSTDYHPERLLPALEGLPSRFLHERALLLSKLGRHEEVLRIYVNDLKSCEMAETYCDQIWRRGVQGPEDAGTTPSGQGARKRVSVQSRPKVKEDAEVYLCLLLVYLSGASTDTSDPPRWLSFLERNFARLDAVKVLQRLPDKTTTLKSVAPYLCKVLRHCATERRYKEVVHQLLRVEELKIKQELIHEQSRSVVITETTICRVPTCKRLIGNNTAILCYPNGTVVHFACGRNDLQTCPVTGQKFGGAAMAATATISGSPSVGGSRDPWRG